MMRLFVNFLAANAGGGLTYIRNVLPRLAAAPDLRLVVAMDSALRNELRDLGSVQFAELAPSAAPRFYREQTRLPSMILAAKSDVLLSAGNFALFRSPVPQILLSRNSIYWSRDFYSDLLARREYCTWLDTRFRAFLADQSIRRADATVAPSESFAAELRRVTRRPARAIYHGFDSDEFFRHAIPLNPEVEEKLSSSSDSVRILFVSHYNYYRNFETLIRSLPLLRQLLKGRSIKLVLTCKLLPRENPGSYNPQAAAQLIKRLGVEPMVIELGAVPYHQLHHLYRRCNLYVTPAYTETFAHPLVEAMASGLPVVASDIPVHREICADAGAYFERFSPQSLATSIASLIESPQRLERMSSCGRERSRQFSWQLHVEQLLTLAQSLMRERPIVS